MRLRGGGVGGEIPAARCTRAFRLGLTSDRLENRNDVGIKLPGLAGKSDESQNSSSPRTSCEKKVKRCAGRKKIPQTTIFPICP